ncbi:MAG: AIR synthase-related protein, partial [Planctomycetota bacterium]
MEPTRWLEALGDLRAAATPCVVVIVTDVRGSAPREVGARMVVAAGRPAWGTIGGGNLERLAIERAEALLADPAAPSESMDVVLSEAAGQCCGGAVTLFLEPFRWSVQRVAIFGAGHVGQAIAGLAPYLRARVRLIDGREREQLVPAPDPDAPARYRRLHRAIRKGLVWSCHDLSEGGFAVALAEMCIAGRLGADIDTLPHSDPTTALFSESSGRLIVEVSRDDLAAFVDVIHEDHVVVGTVTDD